MDIRQLQYLSALAREKHFTRAAAACNVSQPTLSGRIRQLEQELGIPIVERGQRYFGLTPEGERVLSWAHQILDGWAALKQEIAQLKGEGHLSGRITLGVIPSALPMAARLTGFFQAQHTEIDLAILSQTSIEVIRSLEDFSIDAGISYLDNEPIEGLTAVPLYRERYCLFVSEHDSIAGRDSISWAEAAGHPLCLLTPNMQNRRIIDRAFAAANVHPIPRIETNSVVNLYANVRHTELAAIMPEYFFTALGPMPNVRAVPLRDPEVEHGVGLVAATREPMPPLIAALMTATQQFGAVLANEGAAASHHTPRQ